MKTSFDRFMHDECVEKYSHDKEFCAAFEVGAIAAIKWIRHGLHQEHTEMMQIESQRIKYWSRHELLVLLDAAIARLIKEGKV